MATLADLFASSQAPNAQTQLRAQPVAFQRPGGFKKTAGAIVDILAAMGGRSPGYSGTLDAQEAKYNQAMGKQQFQNVFRNFVENPADNTAFAEAAALEPATALKFRDTLVPTQERQGTLPREVLIANMLADPNTSPEVKSRLESLVGPKERQPTGSDFQIIEGANGFQRVNRITGEVTPLGVSPRPPASSGGGGGGNAGPQFLSPEQKNAYGLDPDLPWIIDNKGNPRLPTGFKPPTGQRGAVAPEEVISTIQRARSLLPAASPGGLAGAATRAGEFVGMSTDRSKADAALRVIAGKLTASVPRFEGPQALPEVKLYQAMAADVANSDLPVQSRLAALSEMEALVKRNQQVKAQRRPGAAPAQGGGKTIRFDAQGRRIP